METVLMLLLGPTVLVLIALGIVYVKLELNHRRGAYYASSKKSLWQVWTHIGDYGEYLIYRNLSHMETEGTRFIFNCYLPREDGSTTEIDAIIIDKSGIYVIESKNYSGWIFGDEKSKYWTQSLPRGRRAVKNQFLNPIFQNKLHLTCLADYLAEVLPTYSVIAFSERCTLKKVTVFSKDHVILKRGEIEQFVRGKQDGVALTNEQINSVYDRLFPMTQVDEATKQQHIANIQTKHAQTQVQEPVLDEEVQLSNTSELKEEPICENIETNSLDMKKICPKCGALLTMRVAKSGDRKGQRFLGCSAFPKCKYIENL